MRVRALLLAASAAVVLAGCGSADPPGAPAAATATPAATPKPSRPARKRYRSVAHAMRALARRVEVPVVLPANLPHPIKLAGAGGQGRRGYVTLALAGRRVLSIQFGKAGFDGCGPLNPRAVRVGTAPGVINVGDDPKPRHVSIVWPATLKKLEGDYAISGEFPRRRMLAWAESMQRKAEAGRARRDRGC